MNDVKRRSSALGAAQRRLMASASLTFSLECAEDEAAVHMCSSESTDGPACKRDGTGVHAVCLAVWQGALQRARPARDEFCRHRRTCPWQRSDQMPRSRGA